MLKYVFLLLFISVQAMASSPKKLTVDEASGYYNCYGKRNGISHYGILDIYREEKTGKAILEYAEEEAIISYDYSKASFYKIEDGLYRLKLGRITFMCTPFGA